MMLHILSLMKLCECVSVFVQISLWGPLWAWNLQSEDTSAGPHLLTHFESPVLELRLGFVVSGKTYFTLCCWRLPSYLSREISHTCTQTHTHTHTHTQWVADCSHNRHFLLSLDPMMFPNASSHSQPWWFHPLLPSLPFSLPLSLIIHPHVPSSTFRAGPLRHPRCRHSSSSGLKWEGSS